jgi:serine phosphatase RsbU (regulator of sigma subunit)
LKKIIYILVLFCLSGIAQVPEGKYKKHLTFADTFFGSEDTYQVCYPKEHRMFFGGIFLASGVATILFVIILFLKSKHNKTLKAINKEINEKNKEILDSIHYAKRIQESILPNQSYIDSITNSFQVLYKPRDIVSGDLYWVHKNENGIYIAVIDCTGHGVPGAFLSLLAHNAIEQAVIEKKLVGPSEILASMNSFIKSVLNQNNSVEIKDGMEVGLCLICKNIVTYAGANIKLKYSSNGSLHEVKASKCSVGTVQPSVTEHPVEHVLELKKGERIFMHSDGIVDQFGGEHSKKITSKRINMAIEESLSLSLSQQKNKIDSVFVDWKNNNEQTDDVLIVMYEI